MPVRALAFSVIPQEMEKSKVKRCLFGKPDHESLRKDLDEQLRLTKTEMRSTWNFDADLDKPLDGRYEWTLVKQDDYVPMFYAKEYRRTKFRKRRDLVSDKQVESVSSQVPCTPLRTELYDSDVENIKRENETTPELVSQRQSRIDEHFVKVKRSAKRKLSSSSDEDSDDRRKSRKTE